MEDIILLGLGGHAHSVTDSIEQTGKYNIIGFLDTEEMLGKRFRDYCVLGTIGFLGKGNIRNQLYKQLKNIGYLVPDIIDGSAVVSENAELGDGVFVGKNAVINANAKIGEMCIINTGAIVEHDCTIGKFSHIAVGSVICGGVSVGEQTMIGANATVIQEKEIGSHCVIGAGTIVSKNIQDNVIRYGKIEKRTGFEVDWNE